MSGGRDSGKSFAISCWNTIAAKDYNHRILYTRQTMSSTDNSITEALEGRMEDLGYDGYFDVGNKIYSVINGEGKISITGQQTSKGTQTAKLKSLENFSVFETEEGEELESYDSWNKVKRSMRAKDVQCLSIIVFNPPTKEHWLYEQFYEDIVPEGFNGVKDGVLYIHSTYLDNLDNMAEHNVKEFEMLKQAYEEYELIPGNEREGADPKLRKKWRQYKYEILGGFKEVADGVIYEDWELGEFNESLPSVYGLDFGFDDPDALVETAIDHGQKKIHLREKLYKNGLGSDTLADILIEECGHSNLIIADAAHKRLINDLYHKGLNIRRCKKGAGSVLRRIKTIQGYTLVIEPESKNIIKSVNNYVWHDKRSGVPRHEWSHIPNAFEYASMELIEYY
jgi:phage terminase large subunit